MKHLVDANLSPTVAEGLTKAGFEAVHVVELGLISASDEDIFDRAVRDGLVVVTADSDFGMLLALRRATSPSVVHLRHVAELPPASRAAGRGSHPMEHRAAALGELRRIEARARRRHR